MPLYHIHVTSSDGAIDSPDPEAVTFDGVGAARALAVETLIAAGQDRPATGRRTVTVTVCDEGGALVYRDSVTVGHVDDSALALSRAIGAINQAR